MQHGLAIRTKKPWNKRTPKFVLKHPRRCMKNAAAESKFDWDSIGGLHLCHLKATCQAQHHSHCLAVLQAPCGETFFSVLLATVFAVLLATALCGDCRGSVRSTIATITSMRILPNPTPARTGRTKPIRVRDAAVKYDGPTATLRCQV